MINTDSAGMLLNGVRRAVKPDLTRNTKSPNKNFVSDREITEESASAPTSMMFIADPGQGCTPFVRSSEKSTEGPETPGSIEPESRPARTARALYRPWAIPARCLFGLEYIAGATSFVAQRTATRWSQARGPS
jgi:hypothetical protein